MHWLLSLVLATAPVSDFDARLRALDQRDHAAVITMAEEALELERLDDADTLYRLVLRQDPANDAAYYGLAHVGSVRPLATESGPYRVARDELAMLAQPDRFVERETEHFVILSDADPVWTRIQGHRLERAYDRFVRFANTLDLRPRPVRHKLVVIAFAGRDDFTSFARSHDGPTGPNVAGYYAPATDHLVFYHVESDVNVAKARGQLESMRQQVQRMREQARRVGRTGQRGEAREIKRRARATQDRQLANEASLDAFARARSVAVTVHEAVHQLAFHMHVQSPFVSQPLWFTEGLATAFETDEVGVPFGPDQEFMMRREAFEGLAAEGRLLPLRELVQLDHGGMAAHAGHTEVLYAQSYAFVSWACRHRKNALRSLLRELNGRRGRLDGAGQLEVFEAAFGDIDRVEAVWRRSEHLD